MIVTATTDQLDLVTQADHARLGAEVLALCRIEELVAHPRRDELLRAVREHDCGWWEADAAPRCVDGRPLDFRQVDDVLRLEIWQRAVDRQENDPYVALLVLEHAETLHRDASPALQSGLTDLAERRLDLLEATGLTPSSIRADYRWLHLADCLSLALCGALPTFESGDHRGRAADDGILLDPFPLAGRTAFQLPYRRIPARFYRGDTDLAGALIEAPWQRRRVTVGRAGPQDREAEARHTV